MNTDISKKPRHMCTYLIDEKMRREFQEKFKTVTSSLNFDRKMTITNNVEPQCFDSNNNNNGECQDFQEIEKGHQQQMSIDKQDENDSVNGNDCEMIDSYYTDDDIDEGLSSDENKCEEDDDGEQKKMFVPLGPSKSFPAADSPKIDKRSKIKNVLSSMMNWKPAKGLPKGSREYYATRESLGEEMRQFRKNTMPRLMKNFGPASPARKKFEEVLGFDKIKRNNLKEFEEENTATIRRLNGHRNNGNRLSTIIDGNEDDTFSRCSKRVEAPAAPMVLANDELTNKLTPFASSLSMSSPISHYSVPSSSIYAVPKHSRPVYVPRPIIPEYQNIPAYKNIPQNRRNSRYNNLYSMAFTSF